MCIYMLWLCDPDKQAAVDVTGRYSFNSYQFLADNHFLAWHRIISCLYNGDMKADTNYLVCWEKWTGLVAWLDRLVSRDMSFMQQRSIHRHK